jgi:hypothetical protein
LKFNRVFPVKRFFIAAAFLSLLAGCAASLPVISSDHIEAYEAKYPYGKIRLDDGSADASYVRWNSDYVVTARHVGHLSGTVYVCDTGCDLQFVWHKGPSTYAKWRDGVTGEVIVHMGMNAKGQAVITSGRNLNLPVVFGSAEGLPYRTSSATSIPGMSGGPAYNESGEVIGMTIANYRADDSGQRQAIYVPYSVILEQWHHYQARLRSGI